MRLLRVLAFTVVTLFLTTPVSPARADDCIVQGTNSNFINCSLAGMDLRGMDLSHSAFYGTDLSGTQLSGANLDDVMSQQITGIPSSLPTNWQLIGGFLLGPGANLSGQTLSGLNLANINIDGAVLKNTLVTNSNLSNASFVGADLSLAAIVNCEMNNADFSSVKLDNFAGRRIGGTIDNLPSNWKQVSGFLFGPTADLSSTSLEDIDFRELNIDGANFDLAQIYNANFNGMDLSVAKFTRSVIEESSFQGTDLSGVDFTGTAVYKISGTPLALPEGFSIRYNYLFGPGVNLTTQNFSNMDLTGLNLQGASLSASDFTNANLSGLDLSETSMRYVIMNGTNLTNSNLTGVDLRGTLALNIIGDPIGLDASWQKLHGFLIGPGANLSSVNFQNLDLRTANFKDVVLAAANFSGANLAGVDLSGINLTGVKFNNTNLTGVNLANTTLTNVASTGVVGLPATLPSSWNLRGGYLVGPGAMLYQRNLSGLDLRGLDLTGAMLAEANLANADLRGATLTGATVTDANLSNANLINVVTGALVGTPIGLPSVFSFEEGVIKFKLVLKPVPRTIGVAKVGQTLTAVPGSWDSGVILSYQWLRNGEEIPGASASKYKLTPLDYRKAISVAVTGTGTGGVTATKQSLDKPISIGTMLTKTPGIIGTVAKTKTVTASTSAWVTGAKISYVWLLDGKAIKGAIKSTYKILPSQVGKKLSVLVKQTATGYTAASKASLAVKIK